MSTSFGSILQKALISAFVESEGLTTLITSCVASTSAFLLAYDIRYVAYVVEVEVKILDEALGIDREVVSRFRIPSPKFTSTMKAFAMMTISA